METFLIYIAKSSLAAAAFYLLYLALFQHQKHFTFNRIYLPVSLALSFLIPLITFTKVRYIEAAPVDYNSFAYLGESTQTLAVPAFQLQWFHYLIGIYLLGIFGFLLFLVLGHVRAISIVKKSRLLELFKVKVNITLKDVHPFSFFNKIVLSEKTLNNPDLGMIVQHEEIHVREKHTLDILFAEILFLFQWFNPFAWLLKDAIKNNLEYLTDHELTQTNDAQQYQLAMVGLAHQRGVAPFLTALNGSQLKNRIIMMKKKTENKYALLKQLVVLPLLAVLIMGLSNKEVKTEIIQTNQTANSVFSEKIVKGKVTDEKGDPLEGVAVVVKGSTTGTITDRSGKYELQTEAPNILVYSIADYRKKEEIFEGQPEINVTLAERTSPLVLVPGNNETVPNSKYERVVNIDTGDEEYRLKEYIVGKVTNEKGEPVPGVTVFVLNKSIGDKTDAEGKFKIDTHNRDVVLATWADGYEDQTVEVKGRKEVDIILVPGSETRLKIKSGEEILNVSKSDKEKTTVGNPFLGINSLSKDQPLFVVDGEVYDGEINDIDPSNIQSIDVLKDASSVERYGEAGKNGVILINTKSEEITSDLDLRKFIAKRIKYPTVLQEANATGVSKIYVKVNSSGSIVSVNDEAVEGAVPVDEVVVVAYKPKGVVGTTILGAQQKFDNEAKRVLLQLPNLNIPEFKSETLVFTVKFMLQ